MVIDFDSKTFQMKLDGDRVVGTRKLEKECYVTKKGKEDVHIGV